MKTIETLEAESIKIKKPTPDFILSYGTAGFRADAKLLDSTFFRMGIAAAMRSAFKKADISGVMITASHNKESDNGIKLIDIDGGMLEQSWEGYCTSLANASDDEFGNVLNNILEQLNMNFDMLKCGSVFYARDTRPSSKHLSDLVSQGVMAVGAKSTNWDLLTTPQLHHIVKMQNNGKFSWASEDGYYSMLAEAYKKLLDGIESENMENRGVLYVDCAHGVGSTKLASMAILLKSYVDINTFNTGDGELNLRVGAEYVQKQRLLPLGFDPECHQHCRLASLDGDADRLVYYFVDSSNGSLSLLDGDAIAVLAGRFINEQLEILNLKDKVNTGVVQTAYANGASTEYLKRCSVPVVLAKTGVKYVHHKALEFDIGIYFEANGHGTVIFKDKVIKLLQTMKCEKDLANTSITAINRLLALYQLINQAVGDAISDILLVEGILSIYNWSLCDWHALYSDYPSRQTKIQVKDKSVIKTTADETRVISPAILQMKIDEKLQMYPCSRAFVRPSGTEDAVRVYAEAASVTDADSLALDIVDILFEVAGGVGVKPTKFVG